MTIREQLHELVDRIPEDLLPRALEWIRRLIATGDAIGQVIC